MAKEDFEALNLAILGVSAIFQGIVALSTLAPAPTPVLGVKRPVACPNCGQPFDASVNLSPSPPTLRVDKLVSCPRCWYTWVP